jgi:hypothetical protein
VRLNFDFPLPPPWVRGVLVLTFLGFGVLIGDASSSPNGGPAAPALRLMLPPAADSAAPSTTAAPPLAPPAESTPEASTPPASSATKPSGSPHTKQPAGSGSGGGSGGGEGGGEGVSATKLPAVKHVFVIVLADEPYAAVFGPASKAAYLAHTLEKQGELLVRYYAVAHDELANGVALLSGQGPTAQTADNCPTFADLAQSGSGADGQVLGSGCVYPASTKTLAGQLAAKHLTWKAYVEDMSTPGGSAAACVHPPLGAADPTVGPAPPASGPALAGQGPPADVAVAGARYATFRNPFVYFHGVIDSAAACAKEDVGLEKLHADLASARSTPSLSYIVPSLCDDGSPTPCAAGQAGGMGPADAFLHRVVPEILAAKAYKESGLLAITVDQAPGTGLEADSSACCGQPRFPGLPASAPLPGGGQLPPAGGGQVGALLLSRFVKAGNVDQDPYNHFALLRTIEDLFGLGHLGYAGGSEVKSFEAATVFGGG